MTVHMSCVNVHTCAVTRTPTSSDVLVFVQPATRVAYQAGTGAACYVFQQAEVAVPLPLVMHVPPHHVPSHWQLPAPLEVVSEHLRFATECERAPAASSQSCVVVAVDPSVHEPATRYARHSTG